MPQQRICIKGFLPRRPSTNQSTPKQQCFTNTHTTPHLMRLPAPAGRFPGQHSSHRPINLTGSLPGGGGRGQVGRSPVFGSRGRFAAPSRSIWADCLPTPYPDHPRVPYLGYEEESARLQAALDAQLAEAARARAQEQELLRQKEQLLAALALKQRLDKEAEEQRLAALREEERRRTLAEFIPQRLAKWPARIVTVSHIQRSPFLDLLTQLFDNATESSALEPPKPAPSTLPVERPAANAQHREVQSLPDLLNLLFQKPAAPATQAKPALEPKVDDKQRPQKPAQPSVQAQFYAAGPSSPPTNTNKAEQTKEQPRTQTPVRDATLNPATESLKEQLEARLNNEYATEVKDTIQALLASLSDSGPRHGKGKGKEVASEATPVPTVSDVAKSIQTVHNIETTFSSLESEFVFPAQLDFTPPSSPSTLVSPLPGTENATVSDSANHHLAFTARNQPLRFYEHALGELLSQLDRIDSFGNEELRARRKEVVGRVERALEALEGEVDARWQIRQKKLAKEQKQVTEVVSAPNQEEHPAHVVEPTTATTEDSQTETPPSLVVVPPSSPSSQPFNTPDDNSLLPPVELDVKQVPDVLQKILSLYPFPESAPLVEIETSEDIAHPSPTPTADSSIATIKLTHDEEEKVASIDTFLLPAQPASPTTSKTHSVVDVDSASECQYNLSLQVGAKHGSEGESEELEDPGTGPTPEAESDEEIIVLPRLVRMVQYISLPSSQQHLPPLLICIHEAEQSFTTTTSEGMRQGCEDMWVTSGRLATLVTNDPTIQLNPLSIAGITGSMELYPDTSSRMRRALRYSRYSKRGSYSQREQAVDRDCKAR
ncbi:BAG domain-containing protein [Salix suchowensis]|nr:BAG domain-containing protein [Salix suchowensis]